MEYEGIKHSNKIILMKVTSRERPETLVKTISSYISFAANTKDMVWLFSFDEDDVCGGIDFSNRLIKEFGESIGDKGLVFVGKSEGKIHAINRDVPQFQPHWDILLNISDDQVPIYKGYDDVLRRFMPDDLDASLWFNDGAQTRINTQEIIGRNYYLRTGFIYNPIYKSFYCDNEATEVAQRLKKLIRNPRCLIKHVHPAITGGPQDELYKKNNKYWHEDQKTWNNRIRSDFQ